jgi:hypothetical protein
MTTATDYDTDFDGWYDAAEEALAEVVDRLVELRGFRPAGNWPVQQGLAFETLADMCRARARRVVTEAVEAKRMTWTSVGKALRISRQGARKRFS